MFPPSWTPNTAGGKGEPNPFIVNHTDYRKAGIFLADIVADSERQQNILMPLESERMECLMKAIDRINWKHGHPAEGA